jgi:hypothetical protein
VKGASNTAQPVVATGYKPVIPVQSEGALPNRPERTSFSKDVEMVERAQQSGRSHPSVELEKQLLRYNHRTGALVIRDYFSKKEQVLRRLDVLTTKLGGMVKSLTLNGQRIFTTAGGKHGS